MEKDRQSSCKNPPIGQPKGIIASEFCDCPDGMVVIATVKGREFRYCNKCSRKIKKEEKNGSKKPGKS